LARRVCFDKGSSVTECSLDTKRLWVVIATVVINVVAVSPLTLAQYQSKMRRGSSRFARPTPQAMKLPSIIE